jgi:hypothetical protein
MTDYQNKAESKNNAKRLTTALKLQIGPTEIHILARILNYEPDQLVQDIQDMYDIVFESEERRKWESFSHDYVI